MHHFIIICEFKLELQSGNGNWVVTSVTLTFDLWPWPFAWTSLLSLVITPGDKNTRVDKFYIAEKMRRLRCPQDYHNQTETQAGVHTTILLINPPLSGYIIRWVLTRRKYCQFYMHHKNDSWQYSRLSYVVLCRCTTKLHEMLSIASEYMDEGGSEIRDV